MIALYRECLAYNKSLKYRPVEGYYDGEYKQGELLDLSVFPGEVRNAVDDNWGEPITMEHDFSIEEMLDMPTEGEVLSEPIIANIDCMGQDGLCKVESHGAKLHGELFCITEKNSDYIDIDALY